jgi:hypothetical protein
MDENLSSNLWMKVAIWMKKNEKKILGWLQYFNWIEYSKYG